MVWGSVKAPRHFPREVLGYVQLGRDPGDDPGHAGKSVSHLAWECLGFLPKRDDERNVWNSLFKLLPCKLTTELVDDNGWLNLS